MFTIRQLEIFCAVARYQSISHAAELIPLSKAAVSQAIKELEIQLGHALFVREKKHLLRTGDGDAFFEQSQKLLNQANALYQTFAKAETLMQLRFGGTVGACSLYAPSLMHYWSQKQPQMDVHFFAGNTAKNCHEISDFAIDLAIVEGRPSADVCSQSLIKDGMCYIASSREEANSIEEVTDRTWFIREPGSGMAQYWHAVVAPCIDIGHVVEIPQSLVLLEQVAYGMGIACVPRILAQAYFRSGRIKELTGPVLPPRDIYLIWHSSLNANSALRYLIDQAADWARDLPVD
ncbi:LysR family transcriptional regulator [Desulfotalea psychrophila]|nr:LysR family transcriptional regulator [Desulfotalea psychrophila]